MCFVREWNTGLEAIAKALILSHHRKGGVERKIPKSLRNIRIQYNSATVEAKALYSASVDDLDIVDCFLADHVMGQFLKNTTMPEMDLRSTGSPAQLASQ